MWLGSDGACHALCETARLSSVAVDPPHLSSLDLPFASAGKLLFDQGEMFLELPSKTALMGAGVDAVPHSLPPLLHHFYLP